MGSRSRCRRRPRLGAKGTAGPGHTITAVVPPPPCLAGLPLWMDLLPAHPPSKPGAAQGASVPSCLEEQVAGKESWGGRWGAGGAVGKRPFFRPSLSLGARETAADTSAGGGRWLAERHGCPLLLGTEALQKAGLSLPPQRNASHSKFPHGFPETGCPEEVFAAEADWAASRPALLCGALVLGLAGTSV